MIRGPGRRLAARPGHFRETEVNRLFTVVISEREHIENIETYKTFLRPFLGSGKVAFCAWNLQGQSLDEAVPDLTATVSRHERWRAIVVCPEERLESKNPFDVVSWTPPADPDPDRPLAARLRQADLEAYAQASTKPLARLMAHLCRFPLIDRRSPADQADPDFAAYQARIDRKYQLYCQMRGEEKPEIELPEEILCMAKRTLQDEKYDIDTSWVPHIDNQYSRFYDRNLYFDKMRYVLFDILPRSHRNYTYDYMRFLYALLILANYDAPRGALRPNRVYNLECRNDEQALCRLVMSYDEKLKATDAVIEKEIRQLLAEEKKRLTDDEAETIFCTEITIPVAVEDTFDRQTLFADRSGYGLARDCPADEASAWSTGYRSIVKALHKFLKQPRRAVKKAGEEMRRISVVDTDKVKRLNSFQKEDIREYIANAETEMAAMQTTDLYDTGAFEAEMASASDDVEKKIGTRMNKKPTVILGAVSIALFLLGFLPLLLRNGASDDAASVSVLMTVLAVAVFAAAGFVCLLFLRYALIRRISAFNGVMRGICNRVFGGMEQMGRYLSCVCSVMRGFSALNYDEENEDEQTLQIRIRNKHRRDIAKARAELEDVYGGYLDGEAVPESVLSEPFAYNFSRCTEFAYPMPFTRGGERTIEFMQPGYEIAVPVDFVKAVTVTMEELYE